MTTMRGNMGRGSVGKVGRRVHRTKGVGARLSGRNLGKIAPGFGIRGCSRGTTGSSGRRAPSNGRCVHDSVLSVEIPSQMMGEDII